MSNEIKFGSAKDFEVTKGFLYFSTIFFSILILVAFFIGVHFAFQNPVDATNAFSVGGMTIKSNHVGAFLVLSSLLIGLFFYRSVLRTILEIIRINQS